MFNLEFKRIALLKQDIKHIISYQNLVFLLLYDSFTMTTRLSLTHFEAF